jgi:subtilisin family serine protease
LHASRRKQYLDWKGKFEDVYKEFVTNHLDSPNRPVKIAVLDTGVDLMHPDMEARKKQIKGRYNWVNNQNVLDRSGHGTHTAGLLLDYAPDAELYVAKITEKELCDPGTIAAVS